MQILSKFCHNKHDHTTTCRCRQFSKQLL